MSNPYQFTFTAIGFLYPGRCPLDDPAQYNDFLNMTWSHIQLRTDLENSVLPLGLIVKSNYGLLGVVMPDSEDGAQKIKPFGEAARLL